MKYFLYLIKHKWYVFIECCKAGIPWRGILHDLSCFWPDAFILSAKYWTGHSYQSEAFSDPNFDLIRLRHYRRNGHHWQHWVLLLDSGGLKPIEIPEKFVKEMWCDWIVAGRLQGNNIVEWVEEHISSMALHPGTRNSIEAKMEEMK